jgi:hypothetical protein
VSRRVENLEIVTVLGRPVESEPIKNKDKGNNWFLIFYLFNVHPFFLISRNQMPRGERPRTLVVIVY